MQFQGYLELSLAVCTGLVHLDAADETGEEFGRVLDLVLHG